MTEPSATSTTLDIFRLPSQVRLVFAVTVVGLSLVVALLSAIGAMLVLGGSALLQHFEPGPPAVTQRLNVFGLVLAAQIAILPIVSILQVLAGPAIIRWRYRTYELGKLNGEAHARFENLISHTGLQPVPHLLTSDREIAPQVFGGLSPSLLLPRHFLRIVPEEQQNALVLHEVAHILNKDVFIAELSNALVRSFAVSATVLLILLGSVLLSWPTPDLTLHVRDAIWFFAEPIQFDISYIPGTMLVCVGALALSGVIIRIGHGVTMLLRERRADLRVGYLSSGEFGNLLILVGRGTGRPGWLANALQLGPDRWTRHEALVEPHRLIRPNMPFMFLLGLCYGLLAGLVALLLNSLAEIGSVARHVPGVASLLPLTLDRPAVFKIWVLGVEGLDVVILGWLLIILLSYSIAVPFRLYNGLKLLGWYFAAFMLFSMGLGAAVAITLGFPSPTMILSFLLVFFFGWGLVDVYALLVSSALFCVVWSLQKKMLNAYYLIPTFRRAAALWLVYVPVLVAMCLAVPPQLVASVRDPGSLVALAQWMREYDFYIPTAKAFWEMAGGLASLLREGYGAYWSVGLPIGAAILALILIAMQCLNFFTRCCCCGEEVDLDFAPERTCGRCGYPLGAWVTPATLPDPDEYLKRRGLERVPCSPARDVAVVLSVLAAVCGAAWFCYKAFSRWSVTDQLRLAVGWALVGVPCLFVLGSVVFVAVALLLHRLGWLESERSDSTSTDRACEEASDHQELSTLPHHNGQ